MSRPYEYSRSRYLLMQIAMWVILLASMGVAALVSHARSRPREIALGEPVSLTRLSVQLPKGWRIERSDDGEIKVIARERERAPFARTIEVTVDRPGFFQSLVTGGDDAPLGTSIDFGEVRGGMVVAIARSREAGSAVQVYIVAHGISDDRRHIRIRLFTITDTEDVDPEDEQLIRRIAASVKKLETSPQLRQR